MSGSGSSFVPGSHTSSRRTPPATSPMPMGSSLAYPSPALDMHTQQQQPHSYTNEDLGFMGYHHPVAPVPPTSWGMNSVPPSPVNLGRPMSTELRSSPTNAYWPSMAVSSESPYIHTGLMSEDVALSAYVYGQGPQRTITPGSSSVASTPSDIGHRRPASAAGFDASYASGFVPSSAPNQSVEAARVAASGPTRRRGVSEAIDPAEHERQRQKKKDYAKTFRDNEKHHFEQLRRRLFPTDPNTRRAECLERAVGALDELETYKARAIQRDAEVEKLRAELAHAKKRTAELEQFVAQTQAGSQMPPPSSAGTYPGYSSQSGWH